VPRMAGDSWDIVTSAGATALAVATMRAIEARKPAPLARDDYAQHFVAAMFSSGMGARTRYFDEFFSAAAAAGIRQMVILASGLDARGYRLGWPAGTTVYELDLPKVLEFKAEVLAARGVEKSATIKALAIDLRDDWPTMLIDNGFAASEPTAWLAEGLLPFLPGQAQDLLFGRVTDLSAPTSLWFDDDRGDPVQSLSAHGWTVETTTARDLLTRYGRSLDDPDHAMADTRYFTAALP
jgi:O-methyltransferase involved in polyketide biosynthesis